MTIDQLITMLASIAACVSAVAAFMVVDQNAQQIRTSLKPELLLPAAGITAVKGTSDHYTWTAPSELSESELVRNDPIVSGVRLRLLNVGREAAKALKLRWHFKIEEAVADLNEKLGPTANASQRLKFENGVLSSGEKESRWASMWVNQRNLNLDFVLPASVDLKGTTITIPDAYLRLFSAFTLHTGRSHGFPKPKPLLLEIEYLDIGGNQHRDWISVVFDFVAIWGNSEKLEVAVTSARTRDPSQVPLDIKART